MSKLYTSVILVVTALALMSNSSGRGSVGNEAVTGAPGESGRTCGAANCHDDGQFDPAVSVELISDASGSVKEAYKPGKIYTTRITVSTSGSPGAYGFQMVALNENGDSMGEWTANDETQVLTLNGRSYIEQAQRISDNVIDVTWESPDSDQGDITFYISANAVNATGSPAGDGSTNSSFTFGYDGTLSTSEQSSNKIEIFPNPAIDEINVINHESANYKILNQQGINVLSGNIFEDQINISQLNAGIYFLRLDSEKEISRFIKI